MAFTKKYAKASRHTAVTSAATAATAATVSAATALVAILGGLMISQPAFAAQVSAAPVKEGVSQVNVTLTDENGGTCRVDHDAVNAGPVTFFVTNKTATAISEVELQSNNRILGEKENLAPGLPTVSFTLTLGGGDYQIYCPGAHTEMVNFKVVGKAATQSVSSAGALLQQGTQGYAKYVDGVVDAMVVAVNQLKKDIDAGNLAAAREDYPKARPFYERIESDVDGFVLPGFKATNNAGNLDYLIDMRTSNQDPKVGWHGFHAIERDLFQNGKITADTRAQAAELQKNVEELDKQAKALQYKPEDLANGAADLLEEVQTTKVTGEEEAFSHYDLVDFAGNVEGAQQAFAFLEPGMKQIDPDLVSRVSEQFKQVNALLDTYRDAKEPGGYKRYTPEIRTRDAAKLSHAIQALQEPLSKIAAKVASAH